MGRPKAFHGLLASFASFVWGAYSHTHSYVNFLGHAGSVTFSSVQGLAFKGHVPFHVATFV